MQERKLYQSLLHGKLETQDIFSSGEVLQGVLYQDTRDWTPEHFPPCHFKYFEAISNQDQGTQRLDEA